MENFDFAWGEPFALRKELENMVGYPIFGGTAGGVEYLPHEHKEHELERWIRTFIFESTGLNYKHVVLLPGATAGLVYTIKAMSKITHLRSIYTDQYYYARYPDIIKNSGLSVYDKEKTMFANCLKLTASPSNPLGEITDTTGDGLTIWDSAYHSRAFCNTLKKYPTHAVQVGTFSKLIGIPGARIGWAATNAENLKDLIYKFSIDDVLGYSGISAKYILNIVQKVNIHQFLDIAKVKIDNNREEMSKLEKFFEEGFVPENGMFLFGTPSSRLVRYLHDAKVSVSNGAASGGTDEQIRISLGQDNDLTKAMANKVLQMDRI